MLNLQQLCEAVKKRGVAGLKRGKQIRGGQFWSVQITNRIYHYPPKNRQHTDIEPEVFDSISSRTVCRPSHWTSYALKSWPTTHTLRKSRQRSCSGTINAANAQFSVVLQSFIRIFHFVKSMKFFLFLLFVSYGSKWFFISTEMCSPLSILVMKYSNINMSECNCLRTQV